MKRFKYIKTTAKLVHNGDNDNNDADGFLKIKIFLPTYIGSIRNFASLVLQS